MNKVYILDWEMVSPLGLGKKAIWESICSYKIAAQPLWALKNYSISQDVAAAVREPLDGFFHSHPSPVKEIIEQDRKFKLGVAAASYLEKSFRFPQNQDPGRWGLSLGIGQDIPIFDDYDLELLGEASDPDTLYEKCLMIFNEGITGYNRVGNPLDLATVYLAERFKCGAIQNSILTACTASSQAIGIAGDTIRDGRADFMIAGGMDSVLNIIGYITLLKLGIVAPDNGRPENICRPFDNTRRGTLLGEGAGYVILASEKGVEALNANPKFELKGWGGALDGYKVTSPRPDGEGMKTSIVKALSRAKITPSQVDYINMHGTGTIANDPIELKVVNDIYEGHPVFASSTKDRHGHLIAAAGIQEFVILLMAMENNLIPANLNLKSPLETKDVKLPQKENIPKEINVGVSHSFAFGGVNSTLVVEKIRESH